jgi:hypothetical protein
MAQAFGIHRMTALMGAQNQLTIARPPGSGDLGARRVVYLLGS